MAAAPELSGAISAAMTTAIVLIAIAVLYFGREIFVPFSLAILLSFMLAPVVGWLRRALIPRMPAVLAVVVTAFIIIGGVSLLVGSQIVNLAQNLPNYQNTIHEKIRSLRSNAPGGDTIGRVLAVFQDAQQELSGENEKPVLAKPLKSNTPAKDAVPVRIEQPAEPLKTIAAALGSLLGPVGTAGIVLVFAVFILLERDDLRDRFIRLVGQDLNRTTEALNEAAARVSSFLLMQLVVNASYGVPIGIGLYLIGVPNALLWGLLATLLRFIPYLGPFIAALFPLLLAFAVDPGWTMLLWTVALLVCMELVSSNIIEPWLYGSSTGLSSVAIILAAIFWTTLWGPVGLVLATPLTVCLVVIGRYVPRLKFLDVVLGSEAVLSAEEQFYQRLLGGNAEEAVELAENYVEGKPLLAFFDEVCLPALRLAENDRQQGTLTEERHRAVADHALSAVQDLVSGANRVGSSHTYHDTGVTLPTAWPGTPVLCIAGRGAHDGAAGSMLSHMLDQRGIGARTAPASAVSPEMIGKLELSGIEVVFISYFHPAPQVYARYICRRLRRRAPDLKVILGCWNLPSEAGSLEALATNLGADAVVTSICDAVRRIEAAAATVAAAPMVPPPVPIDEQARLEALYASGLLDARIAGHLDRVARRVADAFDAPISLVSLIDESCQLWVGAVGLPDDLEESRKGPRETSICGHVVAAAAPLVINDAARDPRFANNPFLRERGIRFYAGAPLRTASGHVVGSLCVLDKKPRSLTDRDLKLLQVIADELMLDTAPSKPATVDLSLA
jgi:predicted PurR-regulated permease PerM/GAF domain-containing protein